MQFRQQIVEWFVANAWGKDNARYIGHCSSELFPELFDESPIKANSRVSSAISAYTDDHPGDILIARQGWYYANTHKGWRYPERKSGSHSGGRIASQLAESRARKTVT